MRNLKSKASALKNKKKVNHQELSKIISDLFDKRPEEILSKTGWPPL